MLEAVLVVTGLVLGAAIGGIGAWLIGRSRLTAAHAAERGRLEQRLAALETVEKELGKQLTERQLDLGDLRAALDGERTERARAEERAAAERRNVEDQRRLLDHARAQLADTFRALSADALSQTSGTFLERARETIDAQLRHREQAVEALLRPLQDALRRAEEQVRELEKTRQQAYGGLEEQLRSLAEQSRHLQRETSTLATALRSSQARGRWGEVALRRVVELAGMTEHCDFVEQVTVEGDSGRLRPDMVVRLPAAREVVVDSKVPLAAYLDAVAATTPDARREALARHARELRAHMTQLANRAYWKQFAQSADLVVMFIPGESFVTAAVEADPDLPTDAMARRVVIATPMILFTLLAAVAHGWQQQLVAKSAEDVRRLGQELYERLATLGGHVRGIGQSLEKAVEAYNDAVGSIERRVLPAARRFRDLGAGTRDDIPPLEAIDQGLRRLTAPEFAEQLELAPEASDAGARPRRRAARTADVDRSEDATP
ncbi:MAG: DNA recombination protein RmuC [Candidatus Rokubacteria bacterium]|nr:DNA recombination protein RmuC [Candidatus Rokubacteria bacterium]